MKNKVARPPKSAGPKMDRYSDLLRRTVRHVRKRMKISQAELAKLAGIEQSSLSKFENGTRNLSAESQERVRAALEQAKIYGKADADSNWGMNAISDPFGFGMRLALPAASPEPVPAPRMSKKLLKDEEALKKEHEDFAKESLTKLPPEYVEKLIESNQRVLDLAKKGYVAVPVDTVRENEELKARIAELEEEVRTLKGQQQ